MSGKTVIESIARSAERLIDENRRLKSEVERLELARKKLREDNRQLAAERAELERRLTVKELATGLAGEAADRQGAKIARARVNRLMREVDKCMVLLNRE